jgi:xanthine dehydrogenase accessory factor
MQLVKDPVCGMDIDENTADAKSMIGNSVFYFCCPHCKARFDKDPLKFTME